MSYGRSKLFDYDVAENGVMASAAVIAGTSLPSAAIDAKREIATLRCINSQLLREVALLKQREAQAQHLAYRDGLTGLYNRRRMLELLESSLNDASMRMHRVGLLFIDLNGFKAINDDYGHAAGDKLLTTVASRIAARARNGDFVCRLGGDEFVVILPRIADMSAAREVADSIGKRIALPYRINGEELNVQAAVGVSLYPDEARSAATLMHLADESMYCAKAALPLAPINSVAPTRRRDDKIKRRAVALT